MIFYRSFVTCCSILENKYDYQIVRGKRVNLWCYTMTSTLISCNVYVCYKIIVVQLYMKQLFKRIKSALRVHYRLTYQNDNFIIVKS